MQIRRFLVAVIAFYSPATVFGSVITQWNFNSNPPDLTFTTGSLAPSSGLGIASLFGGVTGTFTDGNSDNKSSDPASSDDSAWLTNGYPTQSTGSRTAGIEFLASTAGFKDIQISWDQRNSNSASEFWAVDYTLDGTNWLQLSNIYDVNQGSHWFNGMSANFAAISGATDNPNFGIRVLSVFQPSTSTFAATNSGSSYTTSGTARFDLVTFSGTPIAAVPEPASVAFLVSLLLVGTARSKFRLKTQLH